MLPGALDELKVRADDIALISGSRGIGPTTQHARGNLPTSLVVSGFVALSLVGIAFAFLLRIQPRRSSPLSWLLQAP